MEGGGGREGERRRSGKEGGGERESEVLTQA